MPLGMLYTISHLASLAKIPVEWAIAAATGNNADVYRLNSGLLRPGRDADVVVIDACAGGSQDNALDALRNGDIVAVPAVVTDGVPRFVGRSRNTPDSIRTVRVAQCRLPQDFSASAHSTPSGEGIPSLTPCKALACVGAEMQKRRSGRAVSRKPRQRGNPAPSNAILPCGRSAKHAFVTARD